MNNRRLLALTLTIICIVSTAVAYTDDSGLTPPTLYYTLLPPVVGTTYVDPTFGTEIRRVSDAMKTPDAASGSGMISFASTEYSSMSAFNNDASCFIIWHQSYFALYDGDGNYIKDLPFEIHAGAEPRWSRADTQTIYYVSDNRLKKYHIGTGDTSIVRTFSEYTYITGKAESDICFDGDHFVFAGNGRDIFVYEISSDRKGSVLSTDGAIDQIYITPDDNVLITWLASGSGRFRGVELYDRNMNFLRQVGPVIGHMDVTRDTNGDEVMVWANAADPNPICNNGLVKVRLSDGQQTCLISLDWSLVTHTSGPDNGGWVYVGIYAPRDPDPTVGWKPYTNEILQVKLDGTEVRRLAHHRSRPFNSYIYTPRATVSRDGKKLLFSSNFGLQSILSHASNYSDVYMIDLSGGDSSGLGAASGSVDSGSSGVAAPCSSSPARFEQGSSALTLAGTWYPNGYDFHSGGSAVLAMTSGARATFTFNGTGAAWIGYRDPWSGIARVSVDGVFKAEVDTYSSSGKAQAVLYSIDNLPAGQHTLIVEVAGRRGSAAKGSWVWIDAFESFCSGSSASTVDSSSSDLNTEPSGTPVYLEQDNPALVYSGTWYRNGYSFHSGGGATLAMTSGDRVTFTFAGTTASWIGYKDPWAGIARVYVDGTFVAEVDTYASSDQPQQTLYSVNGLNSGTHTLTIEVAGQRSSSSRGSWVWVDAFQAQ